MGVDTRVPPAVLLALVSPTREDRGKLSDADRGRAGARTAASELKELAAFLLMNPEERFDLEAINSIDLQVLVQEARGDKRLLQEAARTAEALLPRVRAETEDPILVGAILRTKTLDWYRRSPSEPSWGHYMPIRWGGIFQESRVPGGRLSRKLSSRISGLIMQCVKASGARAFLRASMTGLFRRTSSVVPLVKGARRPRLTPLVAQAYLDDLAASGRADDHPLPLERLSDLARRNGSADVNVTLVELFPQEGTGTLIVLDQRFHPGMNTLAIRVVPPKTPEDASTYDLIQAAAGALRESAPADPAASDAGLVNYWDRSDLTKKEWLALFKSLEKRKGKLDAPPRENYRDRDSYLGLRDLLVSDPQMRKLFLTVHWKGRPSGLTLLCELLSDGTWVPEVETDADYLEAEMDHIDKGRADRGAKDDQWKLGHGWTVVREVGDANARTYRANGKSKD